MSRFGNGLRMRQQAKKDEAARPENTPPVVNDVSKSEPESIQWPDLHKMPLPMLKGIIRAYEAKLKSSSEEYERSRSESAKDDVAMRHAFLARARPILNQRMSECSDEPAQPSLIPETSPLVPSKTLPVVPVSPSVTPESVNVPEQSSGTTPAPAHLKPLSNILVPSHPIKSNPPSAYASSSASTTSRTMSSVPLNSAKLPSRAYVDPARALSHTLSGHTSTSSLSTPILPVGEGPSFTRVGKGARATTTFTEGPHRSTMTAPGLSASDLATAALAATGAGADAVTTSSGSHVANRAAAPNASTSTTPAAWDTTISASDRALLWSVSSLCRVRLKDHQQQAVLWMSKRERAVDAATQRLGDTTQHVTGTIQRPAPLTSSVRGGVQADDCGLGKTLQCVATVAAGYVHRAADACDGGSRFSAENERLAGAAAARVYSSDSVTEPALANTGILPTSDATNLHFPALSPASVYAAYYHELCLRRAAAAPTLVVCPKAVATQWASEIAKYMHTHEEFRKFCGVSEDSELFRAVDAYMSHQDPDYLQQPLLSAIVYHGSGRGGVLGSMTDGISADVVITTYGTLRSEFSQWEGVGKNRFPGSQRCLLDVMWSRVVLDEAHTVRNIATENFKAVAALSVRADTVADVTDTDGVTSSANCVAACVSTLIREATHPSTSVSSPLAAPAAWRLRPSARWALTATPVHNSVDDLRSVFLFLRATPFDRQAVWKQLFEPVAPAPKAVQYAGGALQAVAAYYHRPAASASSGATGKVTLSGGCVQDGMSVGAKALQERLQAGVAVVTGHTGGSGVSGSVAGRDMWRELDMFATETDATTSSLHLTTTDTRSSGSRGGGRGGGNSEEELPLWVRAALGRADPVEGGMDRGQRRVCALLRGIMVRRLQGEVDAEAEGPVRAPWGQAIDAGVNVGNGACTRTLGGKSRAKSGGVAGKSGVSRTTSAVAVSAYSDADDDDSADSTSGTESENDGDSGSDSDSDSDGSSGSTDDEDSEASATNASAPTTTTTTGSGSALAELPPPVYVLHRIAPSPAERAVFAALRYMAMRGDDEKYYKLLRDDNSDDDDEDATKSTRTGSRTASTSTSTTASKPLSGSAARASALTWLGQLTRAAIGPLLCRGRVLAAALAWVEAREARKAPESRSGCNCAMHACASNPHGIDDNAVSTTVSRARTSTVSVDTPSGVSGDPRGSAASAEDELTNLLGSLSLSGKHDSSDDVTDKNKHSTADTATHDELTVARACGCVCSWTELKHTVHGLATDGAPTGGALALTDAVDGRDGVGACDASVYKQLHARTQAYMSESTSLASTSSSTAVQLGPASPSCVLFSSLTRVPHPPSSKLSYLLLLLSHIALTQPGAHVLLFSQWTTVLDAVQHALDAHAGRLDVLATICSGAGAIARDFKIEGSEPTESSSAATTCALPSFPQYQCSPAAVRAAYSRMGLDVLVSAKDTDLLTAEQLNTMGRPTRGMKVEGVAAPHHRLFATQALETTLQASRILGEVDRVPASAFTAAFGFASAAAASATRYASFARVRRIDGTMRIKDQECAIREFREPIEIPAYFTDATQSSSLRSSIAGSGEEDDLVASMRQMSLSTGTTGACARRVDTTTPVALPLSILMVSTGMGGAGLNLVEAGHVIHLDPLWNPAIRTQASARALRLGQKQTVIIHDFTVSGSVEERVCSVRRDKRLVAEAVVDGKGSSGKKVGLTLAEIRGLFE